MSTVPSLLVAAGLMAGWTTYVFAARESYLVKILDKRDEQTRYSYIIPGHSTSSTTADATCFGDTTVNCSGTARTNTTSTPAHPLSYEVRGATFTLKLPDGRLVVVNCESKYKMKGDYINRRSCRMPINDEVWVEFDGDNAKLEWSVSLDGKKKETETYKILGIVKQE